MAGEWGGDSDSEWNAAESDDEDHAGRHPRYSIPMGAPLRAFSSTRPCAGKAWLCEARGLCQVRGCAVHKINGEVAQSLLHLVRKYYGVAAMWVPGAWIWGFTAICKLHVAASGTCLVILKTAELHKLADEPYRTLAEGT